MKIFFDRDAELKRLIADIEKYRSLIVLYGNRRVAELVKEVQDLLDANDLDKALEKINLVISMYPRNLDLHDLKSDILFNSMDYPGTLKELKFIEAMEPHNASNYSRDSPYC